MCLMTTPRDNLSAIVFAVDWMPLVFMRIKLKIQISLKLYRTSRRPAAGDSPFEAIWQVVCIDLCKLVGYGDRIW